MSIANTAPFGAAPPTLKFRMESARQRSMFFTLRTGSLVVSNAESPTKLGIIGITKLKKFDSFTFVCSQASLGYFLKIVNSDSLIIVHTRD